MARVEEKSACQDTVDRQGLTSASGGVLVGFSEPGPTHL